MAREPMQRTEFGRWLDAKAKEKGLGWGKFVQQMGMSPSTLNDWKRADRARLPERRAIVKLWTVLRLTAVEREELEALLDHQAAEQADPKVLTPAVEPTREVHAEASTDLALDPEIDRLSARCRAYADRYPLFRVQARVALAQGKPTSAVEAAADFLGSQHGDGPSELQAYEAIDRYANQIEQKTRPEGREASDDEFSTPRARRLR